VRIAPVSARGPHNPIGRCPGLSVLNHTLKTLNLINPKPDKP